MRYVWAILALVLATLLIGAGIAQRTIFLGPSTQQTAVEVEQASPYTLVDGAVLRTQAGAQTLLVRGEGEIFAAYGRTIDMQAWLSDAVYNHVFVTEEGEITADLVHTEQIASEDAPVEEAPTEEAEPTPTPGYPARNPAGSDLWLDEFTETEGISVDMQLPEGMSVLIARDGVEDAPTDISVAWPVDNSTPWAGPLVVAGGILMFVGIVLYILAIRFQRRGGGPKRKGRGPLPATEPLDISQLREKEQAAVTSGSEKRSSSRRTRAMLALPVMGLTVALVAGCSPASWPQFGPEETPSPEASEAIVAPENQQAPAITEAQAARILKSIADTVAEADETRDISLLATRMSGMPYIERRTNYKLRETIEDYRVPKAIPTETIEVLLPEAKDTWPRTVMMVTAETTSVEEEPAEETTEEPTEGSTEEPSEEASEPAAEDATEEPTETPAEGEEGAEGEASPEGDTTEDTAESQQKEVTSLVVFTMVQETPWEPYKIAYIGDVQPTITVPNLAPAWLGAQLIPPASPFLAVAPEDIPSIVVDLIDKGNNSEYVGLFDEHTMSIVKMVHEQRKLVAERLAKTGSEDTTELVFAARPSAHAPISLGTLDSGAIVAVDIVETEKITPAKDDVVVKWPDNDVAKALTGVEESTKGVIGRHGIQLYFSVPSQGSTDPVALIAVQQSIITYEVIK